MKSLYICYLPIEEPLVETQVIAYLKGLAQAGHEIHLLTFENKRWKAQEVARIERHLSSSGISWHRSRYHKKPSLPATVWDTFAGATRALMIVRRHKIDVLHARNHVPGMMALLVSKFRKVKLIFDIRGVMAQEYIDGGLWKPGSFPVRITEWVQRRCIAGADGVVVLTQGARNMLFSGADHTASGAPIVVIPSCADVGTIAARRTERADARARLGYKDERVLIYVGKFSTWYLAAEMARFFAIALEVDPKLRFLIVTQSEPHLITDETDKLGVARSHVQVTRCSAEEVAFHLAAADLGISFIKASPSKVASSPTKIAEYLAAGLPLVTNPGVGDVDNLVTRNGIGVLTAGFSDADLQTAASSAFDLLKEPEIPERCVEVARRELDLHEVGWTRYRDLYRRIGISRET